MRRGELYEWLKANGYSVWQIRTLIEKKVIKAYTWEKLIGEKGRGLHHQAIFLESQVRDALGHIHQHHATVNEMTNDHR